MDRNGDDWTGDQVEAEARGEDAVTGGADNRADARRGDKAPRQRPVNTAGEESVRFNDDGDVSTTTAGSGATGESD